MTSREITQELETKQALNTAQLALKALDIHLQHLELDYEQPFRDADIAADIASLAAKLVKLASIEVGPDWQEMLEDYDED